MTPATLSPPAPAATPPRPENAGLGGGADDPGAHRTGHAGRRLLASGCASTTAAIAVAGIFEGVAPFVVAWLGVVSGTLLVWAVRRRRPSEALAVTSLGIVVTGVAAVAATGVGNVLNVTSLVRQAADTANVLRPPVDFAPGWYPVVAWITSATAAATAWVSLVTGRARAGILVPLPVVVVAAISLPESHQLGTGIAVTALLAAGFAVVASEEMTASEGLVGFELRRAVRALVLLSVTSAGLVAAHGSDVLFPAPAIDPESRPREPDTVALSSIEDRVLFEVESDVSGPWRIGSLDVYQRDRWMLPPLADGHVVDVPASGIVQPGKDQGAAATFHVAALDGVVLPALPNTVGVAARGPRLEFDHRSGSLRLKEGRLTAGLSYTVTAASLPSPEALRALTGEPADDVEAFLDVPGRPAGVAALLDDITAVHTNAWDRFSAARAHLLETAVVSGPGRVVPVSPERAEAVLLGRTEASPYEMVATEALVARWLGIPSRIGYGFDGGEPVAGRLQVRPRHGVAFVEVWFPGQGWLPVISTPQRAEPTVGGGAGVQRFDPAVVPGDDAGVELLLPVATDAPRSLDHRVLTALAALAGAAAASFLGWLVWPLVRKVLRRARRRREAMLAGPAHRVALAYQEWRDSAADFGVGVHGESPIGLLGQFADDEEHQELAWLVTRALWGDLSDDVDQSMAVAAEELSRSLRRRLLHAQPVSARVVASLSRNSLRDTEERFHTPRRAAAVKR